MTNWLSGPVAITGADGHVGTHLRARLRDLPNEVRPVGRNDDPGSAVRDAETVIHLAGTLAPRGDNIYQAANVETVRRTIGALEGSTVRRVVFLSYPGADPGSRNDYLRAKGEAEQIVLACGRDAAIVRSTFIYGPPESPGPSATPFLIEAGKVVSAIGTSRRRHSVTVIGSGRQRYAPTYVEDVVEALTRLALDPAAPTGAFALAGPDALTVDEFVDALNGADVKERHLGRHVARLVSHVLPTLTPTMVDVLAADSLPDGSPLAADALGLELHHLADHYPYAGERVRT